jgi:NAD(P)-dependent dehydrogenase (short-subunit alcohol dehydrogenase family)
MERRRSLTRIDIEKSGGKAISVPADCSDAKSIAASFARIRKELGSPEVLINNVSAFHMGSILDTTPEQFENVWKGTCFSTFLTSKEVLPDMVKANKGTIIFTGATGSLRGGPKFAAFASAKFGVRALAQVSCTLWNVYSNDLTLY